MNGTRWLVIAFLITLGGLVAGYAAWQIYTPPVSASRPIIPQERPFRLVLAPVGSEDTARVLQWIPGTIVAHVGDTVMLQVTNTDPDGAHGFALPEANIFVQEIPPGATVRVRFVARRSGLYLFSCGNAGCAPDHADQKGQLVVLGPP